MYRGRVPAFVLRAILFFIFTSFFLLLPSSRLIAQGDPELPWNPIPHTVPAMNYQPPLAADDLYDFLPPGYLYVNTTVTPTPTLPITLTSTLPPQNTPLPLPQTTIIPAISELPSLLTPNPTPVITPTATIVPPEPSPTTTVVTIPESGAGAIFYEQQVAVIVEDATFEQDINLEFAPQAGAFVTATNTISNLMGTTTLLRFQLEAIDTATGITHEQFDHPVRIIVDLRPQITQLTANDQLPAATYEYWLAYQDENDPNVWHEVATTTHQETGLISAEIQHFSGWATGVRPERWAPNWNMPTVNEFSGAAAYSYGIDVPPGRAGLQPNVTISYSSRGLDGLIRDPEQGLIADGWDIAEISISRVGVTLVQEYGNTIVRHPDVFRLVINGSGHELRTFETTTNATVRYYARNAPNLRIYRYYDENIPNTDKLYWVVTTSDGTQYRLGYTQNAETWQRTNSAGLLDVVGHHGSTAGPYGTRTSAIAWQVDTITDVNGNQIQYSYNQETISETIDAALVQETRKTRLASIEYNYPDRILSLPPAPTVNRLTSTPATKILFHSRNDATGTEPITHILVWHGSTNSPIKEYRLTTDGPQVMSSDCDYENGNDRPTVTHRLISLQLVVGTDNNADSDTDTNSYALPATTFSYTAYPHFYRNNGPCFSFYYLTEVQNGYGGRVTFSYTSDNRSVGQYQHPGQAGYPPEVYKWPDIGYNYFATRIESFDGKQTYRTDYSYQKPCYQQENTTSVGSMIGAWKCPAYQGEYRPEFGNITGFMTTTITTKDFGPSYDTILTRVVTFNQDDDVLGMIDLEQTKNSTGQLLAKTDNVLAYYDVQGDPRRFAYIAQSYQYQYQPGDTSKFLATLTTNQYETGTTQGGGANDFFGHLTRRDYAYWQDSNWTTYRHDTFRYRARQDGNYWLLLPWRRDVYDSGWVRQQLSLTYFDYATNNPDTSTLSKGKPTLSRSVLINNPIITNRWYTIDTLTDYDNTFGNPTKTKVNTAYGQVGFDGNGNWNYSVLPGTSTQQVTSISYETGYYLYPTSVKQEGSSGTTTDDLVTTFQIYGFNGVALDGFQKQRGQLKQVTNPNGTYVIYEYDPWGRLHATYDDIDDQDSPTDAMDGDPLQRYRYWDSTWNSPVLHLDPAGNNPFVIASLTRPESYPGTGGSFPLWQYSYFDGLGRVIQQQNRGASVDGTAGLRDIVVTTAYNAQGLARCVTAPFHIAHQSNQSTNAFHTTSCDGAAAETITSYDNLGRPLTITPPGNNPITYAYEVNTAMTAYGHNRLAITRIQDANNHFVRQYHNALGQLVLVREYSSVYPTETGYADTRYQYDLMGNLTEVGTSTPTSSQPGTNDWLRRSFMTYDAVGRKLSMDDPDMGYWSYGYDALGNLQRQTDNNNRRLCFYYDLFNRFDKKYWDGTGDTACPGTSTGMLLADYDYYAAATTPTGKEGLLFEVKWPNDSNKETFTYNNKGLLTTNSRIIDDRTFNMSYGEFDKLNRPTTITYPTTEVVSLTYDHEGENSLEAGSTPLVDQVKYNERSQLTLIDRHSVFDSFYSYYDLTGGSNGNNDGRLKIIEHATTQSTPDPLPDFKYYYDQAGNVDDLETYVKPQSFVLIDTQDFEYDALNRLDIATGTNYIPNMPAYSHDYEYDQLGNLKSTGGSTYDYETWHNNCTNLPTQDLPHAVHQIGNDYFCYDGNGNMITRKVGSVTYTQAYDVENRLTQVSQNDSSTVTRFSYDAAGQRTKTEIEAPAYMKTTVYYPFPTYEEEVRQSWQPCVDDCAEGDRGQWVTTATVKRSIYRLAGQTIATRISDDPLLANNGLFYFLLDNLGSTSLLVTAAGVIVSGTTAYYLPYGGYRSPAPNGNLTNRGFTGHRQQDNVGLIYMNARFYIPNTNRFLTPDSIVPNPADPQSYNRYSYVLNNPLGYIDPSGHGDCDADGNCNNTPLPVAPAHGTPSEEPPLPVCQLNNTLCNTSSQSSSPTTPTPEDYFNWTMQSIEYARSILGDDLSPEELIAFLLYTEVGGLVNDYILEAITRQYNQNCGNGAWSDSCIRKFWGYYSPMLNLFNSPTILKPKFKNQSLWSGYMNYANQVTHRPELGGKLPDRPYGWATLTNTANPETYALLANGRISQGSEYNQAYFIRQYSEGGVNKLFLVLSPDQQATHCHGSCVATP